MSEFQTISEEKKEVFTKDVNTFLKLSKEQIDKILKLFDNGHAIAKIIEEGTHDETEKKMVSELDVSKREAGSILSILFALASRASKKEYPAMLTSDMKILGFDQKKIDRLMSIVEIFRREEVSEGIKIARDKDELTMVILPNLQDMSIITDYRHYVDEGEIKLSVPIFLVQLHLKEEEKDRYINFQTDYPSMKKMIDALTDAYNKGILVKEKIEKYFKE